MIRDKVIFCWSGGKDSALALFRILDSGRYDVVALLTTVNRQHARVSMHGIREDLLDRQCSATGIPLAKVYLDEGSNDEYEKQMEKKLLEYKSQGVTAVVFGDIFLADLREYREKNLAKIGLSAIFPLWKEDTALLLKEFHAAGFRTITCCVSDQYFDENAVGVELDDEFTATLPAGVDACGENGEFHTFCYAGPLFTKPIRFDKGEKIYKALPVEQAGPTKGFWYCDLV